MDFAQVLQRFDTFPVKIIFLWIKFKFRSYLGPVICMRVLRRSRIIQNSLYVETNKEPDEFALYATVFTRLILDSTNLIRFL